MTRGTRLTLTRQEIVARALFGLVAVPPAPAGAPGDAGGRPGHYRLPYPNGGDDPTRGFGLNQPHCFAWAYGDRTPVADCIGFALYCLGIDRKQPGYKGLNGEWLNCAAIVADAQGACKFFTRIKEEDALPGDLLVDDKHVGVIVRRALHWFVDTDGDGVKDKGEERDEDILVIDCSPRHGRESAIGLGHRWSSKCIVARAVWLPA
jgi:hypothetical protein